MDGLRGLSEGNLTGSTLRKFKKNENIKMKNNKGFTLIELVIVIIVLGILSATAIPKFLNIHSDAKKATLESVKGAFNSANSIVMNKATIDGLKYSDDIQTIDGTDINVRYGAVQITAKNIKNAMSISGITLADATALKPGQGGEAVYFYFGDIKSDNEIGQEGCYLYASSANINEGNIKAAGKIEYELIVGGC